MRIRLNESLNDMGNDFGYIVHWEEVLNKCSKHFTEKHKFKISEKSVLEALFIALEESRDYERILDVYDEELSTNDVINILSDFVIKSEKKFTKLVKKSS